MTPAMVTDWPAAKALAAVMVATLADHVAAVIVVLPVRSVPVTGMPTTSWLRLVTPTRLLITALAAVTLPVIARPAEGKLFSGPVPWRRRSQTPGCWR